ncbi:MAG: hypothetical protein HY736_05960 [Verrucomicrobia bacterium]|nr:hypothetical protein [Verrucomicrobiota bacterium]
MNSDPIDDLLRAYSQQPMPPPPLSKAAIWREIEQRRHRSWFGMLPVLSWRELFAEPGMAIAGLVVALIAGMVPVAAARASDTPRLARESLHFDVFTTCPGCMLATFRADSPRR